MEINEAVEKAMEFAWEKAVNDYRNGIFFRYGSLFGRKYVMIGITIKEDYTKHIVRFYTNYPRDDYKAELYVDKKREVLKALRKRCAAEGIVYKQYKDEKGHIHVCLIFHLHLFQEIIERTDAEVRAFQEVLNTRRKDIVDILANAIIKRTGSTTETILIHSRGLSISYGDTASLFFEYRELGLEPIDSDDKVKVLAEAVVANLNNKSDDHYKVRSSSG